MIKRLIFGLVLLMTVGMTGEVKAQCSALNDAIKPGETLDYELKFNWKFIWLKVGWGRLKVDTVTYKGQRLLKTDLQSYTTGFADKLFKMRDTLVAITTEDLIPVYYRKGAEEGKHYSVDEAHYSYKDGLCCVDMQRTKPDEIITKRVEMTDCVYDMLSIMLKARSYDPSDYNPGDKILFQMVTGKKVEEQTLIYRGKENYKAKNDVTYRCLVFSFVEYDKKGEEQEVVTFYITDDRNHLPVRLDMYLNFGSAKAFLTDLKGNKYPLTSIVEEEVKKKKGKKKERETE